MPLVAVQRLSDPLAHELDEMFRAHSRMVYRTAYSVTGSAQDAEDVVQTLFLRLLRSGLPPEFGKNPKGYLYRAAVNLALNAAKSRRRRGSTVDPATLALPAEKPVWTRAAEGQADLQQRLAAAIEQLSPRVVEMLVLRYEHEYSDAEIAKLLGTSRGVVAVTLFRARARLKKLLQA